MLNRHHIHHHFSGILVLCIACCLASCLWLSSGPALAHTTTAPGPKITLSVSIGFDTSNYNMYRIGEWTPVHVDIDNPSTTSFKGTLSVSTEAGPQDPANINYRSPWKFERALSLPKTSHQALTVYVPFYYDNSLTPGVIANVLNTHGKVVATQTVSSQFEIKPGNLLIGVLSDPQNRFDTLSVTSLPNQTSITVVNLDTDTLPTMASILDNFDILVIDDFSSKALHPDQELALETWVNRGGILLEAGGAQWQRTLGYLPANLVPVTISGTTTLPVGTALFGSNDPLIQTEEEQALASPLPSDTDISIANLRSESAFTQNQEVMMAGTIPLFVQAHEGQGVIGYIAVDMTDTNLNNWNGLYELWRSILIHTLGDQMLVSSTIESYTTGPGQLLTRVGLLNMIGPDALPGPLLLLGLLLGYVIILGPVRYLLSRRLKRSHVWSWRIFAASILVFSTLSYLLAFYQRSASIADNSISMIEMNQSGTSAHVTTYAGIFVPNQGDFTLNIPGESLAQPIANQFQLNNSAIVSKVDQDTTITASPKGTALGLHGLPSWSLHYTTSEQDVQFHGGLTTHLALTQNRITGTISNTLNTSFNDLYILMPHSFAFIGHIGAGETLQVNAPFISSPKQPGKTLADQLAEYNGLPSGYFPYSKNDQPQSETQRHIALLSALEGAGFTFPACQGPCKTYGLISKHTIFITGGRVPNPNMNTYEPLLLDNAPATLIGWADQSLTNDVTINGWHPIGHRENFMQMPLNINLANATNIPPDLITGQVVDLQSYDAELTLPGIYTMTEGNITFEMTLPNISHALPHGLTINEPDLWANPFGPGNPINASHMHAQLYNWLTNAWDMITFQQDAYSTMNIDAYVGPAGRVLLQLSNQDETLGKLYFGKPSLSLHGDS